MTGEDFFAYQTTFFENEIEGAETFSEKKNRQAETSPEKNWWGVDSFWNEKKTLCLVPVPVNFVPWLKMLQISNLQILKVLP